MDVVFSSHAWDDYQYWQQNDRTVLKRINALIKDIHVRRWWESASPNR